MVWSYFNNLEPKLRLPPRGSVPRSAVWGSTLIMGHLLKLTISHLATIRLSGTSTSLTPWNEKSSLTKYVAGSSEPWRTIVPAASVTAA